MTEVLDACEEGVLVFNENLALSFANETARRILRLGSSLPRASGDERIESLARRAAVEGARVVDVVDVWNPEKGVWRLTAAPLAGQEGVIVTLLDIASEQRATLVRRQFVAHASHELKSPVAGIQALAEAAASSAETEPEETRSFLQRLIGETERLSALVNDLLDLSRLEEPSPVPSSIVALHRLVEEETADVQDSAAAAGVEVRLDLREVEVRGDQHQLRLLIRNLLDNALRHTPRGGQIGVTTNAEEGTASLGVADTGSGIPLKHQGRVFERFFRVDEGRGRKEGGTGLGLAIVKHVAELHGGSVELKSTLGEGSRFTVRLPQSPR